MRVHTVCVCMDRYDTIYVQDLCMYGNAKYQCLYSNTDIYCIYIYVYILYIYIYINMWRKKNESKSFGKRGSHGHHAWDDRFWCPTFFPIRHFRDLNWRDLPYTIFMAIIWLYMVQYEYLQFRYLKRPWIPYLFFLELRLCTCPTYSRSLQGAAWLKRWHGGCLKSGYGYGSKDWWPEIRWSGWYFTHTRPKKYGLAPRSSFFWPTAKRRRDQTKEKMQTLPVIVPSWHLERICTCRCSNNGEAYPRRQGSCRHLWRCRMHLTSSNFASARFSIGKFWSATSWWENYGNKSPWPEFSDYNLPKFPARGPEIVGSIRHRLSSPLPTLAVGHLLHL